MLLDSVTLQHWSGVVLHECKFRPRDPWIIHFKTRGCGFWSLNRVVLRTVYKNVGPPSKKKKKSNQQVLQWNIGLQITKWTSLNSNYLLTGGNSQKWKRVSLTCPCHEIYRDEAVGLKSCKNTWKITIFVKMWNLGQYRENLIFCQ